MMLVLMPVQKTLAGGEQVDAGGRHSPFAIEATYFPVIGRANAPSARLEQLQGGEHESNRNGRPLHMISVSPSLRVGDAAAIRAAFAGRAIRGEAWTTELEEGYARLGREADGPVLKLGRFYTEFGRINPQHFEDADFVDKPVVHKRVLGPDVLAGWGISAAVPFGERAAGRVLVNVQSPGGGDATSFLSGEGESLGGRTLIRRRARGLREWLHLVRWEPPAFRGERGEVRAGVSVLRGPNASGRTTGTQVLGADFLLRTRGRENTDGAPAFSWHAEWLARRYEGGDPGDPTREILRDAGWSSQCLYAPGPHLRVGLRLDRAAGSGGDFGDPERDARRRSAVLFMWQPREDLSLRVQLNRVSTPQVEFGRARILVFQLRWHFETDNH
ncbi:MAG: hypothetical protein WAO95_02175 [Burkholderiales bacterium]